MKCKVITESRTELEKITNSWLDDNPGIEIKHAVQTENATVGYVTLTIFYLNLKESRKEKLEQIDKN